MVPRQKDLKVFQTEEIKFLWAVQECSRLVRVHNDDVRAALHSENLVTSACHYKIEYRGVGYARHRKRDVGQPR